MTEPLVLLKREGAVAVVTLNRPEVGNTINMDLVAHFNAAVQHVAQDDSMRCLVLTGAGKLFCGGGDIGAMADAGADTSGFLYKLAGALHVVVERLAALEKPLVVLVNGAAAGAGLSLAIAGDVVWAARSASFMAAYGGVGLTPDGGMSWALPRLVGLRKAQEIIIGGRRIAAEEAAQIGLITRCIDDTDLYREGLAYAQTLADGPVQAMAGARALLNASQTNGLSEQLALEASRIAQAGQGAEAHEGISAFLARRKPDFRRNMP